jgi:hypothetical protein
MTCKYCGHHDLVHAYTPAGSKIDLKIHVCARCGLVQGVYDVTAYE